MVIVYEKLSDSRYSYQTDRTQPHEKGKAIAGFANSIGRIRQSVRAYLGHNNFSLIEKQ